MSNLNCYPILSDQPRKHTHIRNSKWILQVVFIYLLISIQTDTIILIKYKEIVNLGRAREVLEKGYGMGE